MSIPFTKMHGASNDYVYLDCIINHLTFTDEQLTRLAIAVSDRHKGIGSDGLVLIMPSQKADFRMRMFNADGSEAQMCGNASRCVAKYVREHKHTTKDTITLETLAGIKTLIIHSTGDTVTSVTVNMGQPRLTGLVGELTCVDMGNPHAVTFVDDLDSLDINTLGPRIEHDKAFPDRTNAEFVRVLNRNEIAMRVWERGSGETQACGTGACAATVACINKGLTDNEVDVHLPGGILHVAWDGKDVLLTGPAQEVFTGTFKFDNK